MTLHRSWFGLVALVLTIAATSIWADQPASVALVLDEPRSDTYLTGPVTLRATLTPEAEFVRGDFFVDGVVVCRVTSPPLSCQFDAGQGVRERQVRVAVTLKNGRRAVANVRTAKLDLDDRSSVTSVLVPVVVWDWRGKFVPGLRQRDFAVEEDGVAQNIGFFQAEDIPLELAFAIDISGSMAPILERVKTGLKSFMGRLKPIDRVTLVAFNERVFVLARGEADQQRRIEAIDRLAAEGGTAILDALVRSTNLLGQQISRRAIIAFTDGLDLHSLASLDAVEARLRNTDITVYLITYGFNRADDATQSRLLKLAEATGGRLFPADKIEDLPKLLERIAVDLSQHYLLGYTPTNSDAGSAPRAISVTVPGRRNFELKYRRSYQPAPPQ